MVNFEVPLAGFFHCHAGIISQLQVFAELPALQAAAAQSRKVATDTLAITTPRQPSRRFLKLEMRVQIQFCSIASSK